MWTIPVRAGRGPSGRGLGNEMLIHSDGGFFVFGDLSVKIEGEFRLKFTLFEMRKYVVSGPSRSQWSAR